MKHLAKLLLNIVLFFQVSSFGTAKPNYRREKGTFINTQIFFIFFNNLVTFALGPLSPCGDMSSGSRRRRRADMKISYKTNEQFLIPHKEWFRDWWSSMGLTNNYDGQ